MYFGEMTEIIFEHGGTLDKFIGDGLMALFGAPYASPDDPINAVRAADRHATTHGDSQGTLPSEEGRRETRCGSASASTLAP